MPKTYTVAALVFIRKDKVTPNKIPGLQASPSSVCVEWAGCATEMQGFLADYMIGVRLFEDKNELAKWQADPAQDEGDFTYGAQKALKMAIEVHPYDLP